MISMQGTTRERLIGCFEQVFPDLDRSAIPTATHDTVAEWDSIAQVTILSLVGEEFGMDIDFEEFEGATSFSAILELLSTKIAQP
jgi:acyl carrier protein